MHELLIIEQELELEIVAGLGDLCRTGELAARERYLDSCAASDHLLTVDKVHVQLIDARLPDKVPAG